MIKPHASFRTFVTLMIVSTVVFLVLSYNSNVNGQEEKPADSTPNTEGAPAQYVGSEECAACHEEVVKNIEKNPHGRKSFEMRSDRGCESCHGPGSAHVESGGDIALIVSFKQMKPQQASTTCLGCHERGEQTHWRGSVHERRGLGCVSCHSIHHPKSESAQLKSATEIEQCSSCHIQIKAQIQRSSHHPVREGLMGCSDCHNPHGTESVKMLTANSVNEQCYSCHTEKRGPFLWEHPPVRENCLTCHTPHGSNHPKLMVSKRPYLCQSCHLDTRHPGTLYDRNNLLISNREFARSCSNCHLTVHGSNHPSGWTFVR